MKLYKGFDKDMKCGGFQFEVGKEYKEEKADICNCGFHACENPFDVLGYYPPADSRYCEVDLDANEQTENDSKRVGKRIKISAEIGLPELVKAGIEYIKEHVDWENEKESNTGYQSVAANTGNWSATTNTGNRSVATNTGDQSVATNTGYQSAAAVEGKESVAFAMGRKARAKGGLGCFIVLAEWKEKNGEWHIVDVKSAKVDGKEIKENTFYSLKEGRFVETE